MEIIYKYLPYITPVIVGIFTYFIGLRKSGLESDKLFRENYEKEVEITKMFREQLLLDNTSLMKHIEMLNKKIATLEKQIDQLTKFNCSNKSCPNRK